MPVEIGERDAGARDDRHLAVVEKHDVARVARGSPGMSDATKNSSSPSPTTTGGPLRTATIVSGSSAEISTSANSPRSCVSARRTAAARPSPRLSCSTRCATISVSVSVTNVWPSAVSSRFSSR